MHIHERSYGGADKNGQDHRRREGAVKLKGASGKGTTIGVLSADRLHNYSLREVSSERKECKNNNRRICLSYIQQSFVLPLSRHLCSAAQSTAETFCKSSCRIIDRYASIT